MQLRCTGLCGWWTESLGLGVKHWVQASGSMCAWFSRSCGKEGMGGLCVGVL
jgi:hypothetical protein